MPQARHMIALSMLAAGALAGCASATNGSPAAAAQSLPTSAGTTVSPARFSAALTDGMTPVSSVKLDFVFDLAGQKITGDGAERLSSGQATAIRISETFPAGKGQITIVKVDGKLYAKLPTAINPANKPWILLRKDSRSATVRKLADSLSGSIDSSSVSSSKTLSRAANSITAQGRATVHGTSTSKYRLIVDVRKVPNANVDRQALRASGLKTIPVELYLDDANRPVEVDELFTVQGERIAIRFWFHDYDAPVAITAPPADQVSTD
jgi:hypothetical protein